MGTALHAPILTAMSVDAGKSFDEATVVKVDASMGPTIVPKTVVACKPQQLILVLLFALWQKQDP